MTWKQASLAEQKRPPGWGLAVPIGAVCLDLLELRGIARAPPRQFDDVRRTHPQRIGEHACKRLRDLYNDAGPVGLVALSPALPESALKHERARSPIGICLELGNQI